jgi:hypothetical protein
MLRITHTQVAQGAIYLTDIDDGLPNKTAKARVGDPKKYQRDGTGLSGADRSTRPGVGNLKQKCYIPRLNAANPALAGYIDLKETDRVLISQAKGDINGFRVANLVTVTSFLDSDVAAPVVVSQEIDAPGGGQVTITGTGLTSLAPDFTTVTITGTGAVTLTQTQITGGGGTVSGTSIVIPAALIPGVVKNATSAQVRADNQLSTTKVLAKKAVITTAELAGGILTLTGTDMTSSAPDITSIVITGTGAVTVTQTQITGAGGTVSATSIVIPAAIIPGVAESTSSARVTANNLNSNVAPLT